MRCGVGIRERLRQHKLDVSTNVTSTARSSTTTASTRRASDGADCHWECMYVNARREHHDPELEVPRLRHLRHLRHHLGAGCRAASVTGICSIENNWFDTPGRRTAPAAQRARATGVSLAWCQNSSQGYRDVLVRFNSFQRNTGIELDRNMSCRWENVGSSAISSRIRATAIRASRTPTTCGRRAIRPGRCAATDRQIGDAMPYAQPASGKRLRLPAATLAHGGGRPRPGRRARRLPTGRHRPRPSSGEALRCGVGRAPRSLTPRAPERPRSGTSCSAC